jgi:hypothetical protein
MSTARSERDPGAIDALAEVLQQIMSDVPEAHWRQDAAGAAPDTRGGAAAPQTSRSDTDGNAGMGSDNEGLSLARWILNAQAGGSLGHRVLTVPLLVDGRLVELDIALFEQSARREGGEDAAPLKHRQLVLSLSTETLGRVDVQVALAGEHARVNVQCERAEASEFMSLHSTQLAVEMEALGVSVDELRYAVREEQGTNVVLRSVAEHLVSPGSVSRLM